MKKELNKVEQQPFLPYGKQSISNQDIKRVTQALTAPMITRGPIVEEFEQAIANYCGAKYAVAFNSGTAALYGACFAADVGSYDRLITTPNSFIATAAAGMQLGATPFFVDIDLDTGNLNLEGVKELLLRPYTRGKDVVIPVHFAGVPVDLKALDRMVVDPETIVIEDAAHALGSCDLQGNKVGSCAYSHMAVFSFHPLKNITTGEGGLVTTNDEKFFHRLRLYRNSGIERDVPYIKGEQSPWYYEVQEITGNYNLTDIQAALGLGQLERLEHFILQRRELVTAYRQQLKGEKGIRLMTDCYDALTAFHLMVVLIDFETLGTTRTDVMHQLMEKNIGSQLHYIPLYRHPVFAKKGDSSEAFPVMEEYYAQALSLPLFYEMTTNDVSRVVNALREISRSGTLPKL